MPLSAHPWRAMAVSIAGSIVLGVMADAQAQSRVGADVRVIPMPARVDRQPGEFTLRSRTRIVIPPDAESARVARYLADLLFRTCKIRLEIAKASGAMPADGVITFVLTPDAAASSREGYTLDIHPRGIVVQAKDPRGLFYGSVTLWQWLTAQPKRGASISIPAVHIEDQPRFAWRGFMLDSARHFMPAQLIRKMLDAMALHKLNTFHWHLTDDQGWRLQILKYPRLTEVGSHGVSDGFYSQEDIRAIVQYAADRYITIVPEIDIPGHAQAAIAAYPRLGTEGDAPNVSRDWGVHDYLLNADESTFGFLEDVLTEVMGLFPGEFIHLGGDEAVKDRWHASPRVQHRMHELGVADEKALQGYFVKRMGGYLREHGRRLIGWDEILDSELPPQATIMSWRGAKGAEDAAARGHDVILATSPDLYLDHLQSDLPDEPPGRPTVESLESVHAFDVNGPRVVGAQLNAWTEHMRTPERVEHAAFPRMAALAEVLWAPPERRSWDSFVHRLPAQFERYRRLGIRFSDGAFAVRMIASPQPDRDEALIELTTQVGQGDIHYTLDDAEPALTSPRYTTSLRVRMPGTVRAVTFLDGRPMSAVRADTFTRASLRHRSGDELRSCSGKLPLRLEDDAPVQGERAVFNIDILDPCWIFRQADLTGIKGITAAVGQIPFNFQVGADARGIPLHVPVSAEGELEVHLDSCTGERIASLPLAPATSNPAVTPLPPAVIAAREGRHDLCLYFTRRSIDPLWAIEGVQLLE